MYKPTLHFAISPFEDEAKVEVKTWDSRGNVCWNEIPDSFTADDLDAIADMFASAARGMRIEENNRD
jgi:hypothetical protein